MKSLLEQLLFTAVRELVGTVVQHLPDARTVVVERTHDRAHGDFDSKVALRLSKGTGKTPREVAEALVGALPASVLVARVEVGGNGFINFFLAPGALAHEVRRVHELGDAYGHSSIGAGERVIVGALSGPRDVVQGWYAAHSDALAKVLGAAGYEVQREALLGVPAESAQSPGGSERDFLPSRPAIEGFFKHVRLHRGKDEVQIPTLHALRKEIGDDACRFFFLLRSPQQPLDFDLKLATSRTPENPLYSVQYAHARVASVMKEVTARAISFDLIAGLDQLNLLDKPTEQSLIATLLRFPDELESAAANCAPHAIVYYLRELANSFHIYYTAETWLVDEVALRNARLALVLAAGRVIRNGLALIGVSAPESM